jgi:hypothetical protein
MALLPDFAYSYALDSLTLRQSGQLQNMQLTRFFSQLQHKQLVANWVSTARDCRNALQPAGHSPPLSLAPG